MRSIFCLLSASCAVSRASECQAEETSLLQGRTLVHHKRNKADDTLARADAAAVMMDPNIKRQIHRFRVHAQDELVSLLQDSQTIEAMVYQICAVDDEGIGEETFDSFSTPVDTCGTVTASNEAGEVVARAIMCTAFSVAAGSCFSVVESPDFFNETDGAETLATLVLQDDVSNTSDVFLIDLPDIGESGTSKAMDEIKTKTDQFPGAVVLFHGKQRLGSNLGRWRLAYMIDLIEIDEISSSERRRQRRQVEEQYNQDQQDSYEAIHWEQEETSRRRTWHADHGFQMSDAERERRHEWEVAHHQEFFISKEADENLRRRTWAATDHHDEQAELSEMERRSQWERLHREFLSRHRSRGLSD